LDRSCVGRDEGRRRRPGNLSQHQPKIFELEGHDVVVDDLPESMRGEESGALGVSRLANSDEFLVVLSHGVADTSVGFAVSHDGVVGGGLGRVRGRRGREQK
jgi:hypothetical protein